MGRAGFWRWRQGEPARSPVRFLRRPSLQAPVLVAAFEGWNDAGEAASTAVGALGEAWRASALAEIEGEEFFDFTQARPEVVIIEGETREITWPLTGIAAATGRNDERDVVLVSGPEPHMRWQSYTAALIGLARDLGVTRAVLLGAYLSEVTHTRAVPLSGSSTDEAVLARHNLASTRYEGPTGIVGVLGEAFGHAGIEATTVWASVPCYSLPVSAKAALALARATALIVERPAILDDLEEQAVAYEQHMDELIEEDESVAAYVARLEEMEESAVGEMSADGLAEEIERYLRGKR
jgi:hypothetical protein